jgi:hypothetical protein
MLPLQSALDNRPAQAAVAPTPAEPAEVQPRGATGFGSKLLRCLRRLAVLVGSVSEWLFGLVSVMIGLAVLASVPVLQLLSLGYLLESSGRVVRTGRLRAGFVGVRPAARLGSVALGTWLILWPARAVTGLWYSSWLLNGPSRATRAWWLAMVAVSGLTIVLVLWAWYRGGRLRHFVWPAPLRLVRRLQKRGVFADARDRFWQFVAGLQLPKLFWLGLRGGLGAMVWLAVPVTLLMLASRLPVPAGVFSGLIGALSLATVLLYLPFLQARFAASDRWGDLFHVRAVRRDHIRAPLAFWIALLATLALALPLYLLKAELVPREAVWLPSLIFVVFIWPARGLTGWAVARAQRRDTPRHFIFRWLSRFAMLPVVLIYVLVVYFTQYVSWYGGLSLYEQHAFLLPVPFLGL